MVKTEVLVLFFTFFLVYTRIKVNSKVVSKVTNIECFPDLAWVNMTCNLKAVSWKKTLVNIQAELNQDVNNLMIHAQVFKRYNSYQPFPIKLSFELCALVGGNGKNNIFTPLIRGIIEYSNINHSCPYHKGEKLFAKDLDWQQAIEFMSKNLPGGAGRYKLDINFYGNGAKVRSALIVGYADFSEV